jgi:hypothetical protein
LHCLILQGQRHDWRCSICAAPLMPLLPLLRCCCAITIANCHLCSAAANATAIAPQLRHLLQPLPLPCCCCANSIVGVFDDSLFSVHRPQRSDWVFEEASKGPWAKMVFCEILNSLFRVT